MNIEARKISKNLNINYQKVLSTIKLINEAHSVSDIYKNSIKTIGRISKSSIKNIYENYEYEKYLTSQKNTLIKYLNSNDISNGNIESKIEKISAISKLSVLVDDINDEIRANKILAQQYSLNTLASLIKKNNFEDINREAAKVLNSEYNSIEKIVKLAKYLNIDDDCLYISQEIKNDLSKKKTFKKYDKRNLDVENTNNAKKKTDPISILKGFSSAIVWGFGQLLNKQYLKALFFFVIFASFIGLELGSSNLFVNKNPYDYVNGKKFDFDTNYPNIFIDKTFWNIYSNTPKNKNSKSIADFEKIYGDGKTKGSVKLTEELLINYLAKDILKNNPKKYINIFTNNETLLNDSNKQQFSDRQLLIIKEQSNIFMDQESNFYRERNVLNTKSNEYEYVKTSLFLGNEDETSILKSKDGLIKYTKTGEVFIKNNNLYTKVDSNNKSIYINVLDTTDQIVTIDSSYTKIDYDLPLYLTPDNKIYKFYNPGTKFSDGYINYKPTEFSNIVNIVIDRAYSTIGNTYDSADLTKFMFKLWLEMNPEEKITFEKNYTNFYFEKAGIFVKSYWGLFTLGQTKKRDFAEYNSLKDVISVNGFENLDLVPLKGHYSIQILLESLIGVILSLFFLIFMIWSIRDAYKTSKKKKNYEEILTTKEYFVEVYEKDFEYIVLSPALFVLAFISIMPILFGFLLAFTSVTGNQAMTDTFSWNGFKNFIIIFDYNSALGQTFGRAFWSVLLWTIIWAIFSTFTVFFGGFFQALIVNSERVVFKKFWRTLLILPWAVPAILSQIIFKVVFAENGYINSVFNSLGINNLLKSMGWLGQPYNTLTGIEKFFYLGEDNIQWFTNPFNPSAVRTALILVNVWLGFSYFMALMTGIMTSIDKSLYEAADIDGATGFQKLKKITMPLVLSATAPILIMTFSGNFNNFGVIYFITGGGPNAGNYATGFAGDTDILISWMYKLTVDEQIYNIASVFSILIFLFVGSVSAWNLSRTKAFKGDI